MSDSWRNILERAAENLSIDLHQNGPGTIGQPAGWPAPRGAARQPRSFAEPRDLLEHELKRQTRKPAARSSKARAAAIPQQPEKSRKKGPLGEFAPTLISVAIVALTIYAIYNMLH